MPAAKWTTNVREIVVTQADDGSLFKSIPYYRDGVKQMTEETRISPDGHLDVRYLKAPGCTLRGFTAGSDF